MATIYTTYPKKAEIGIPEFYGELAKLMFGKEYDHYDCSKVCVGKSIQEDIFNYYKEQRIEEWEIGMLWVCYGPKATLNGYEIEADADWAYND